LRDVIAGIRHERSLAGDDDHSLRIYGYANALALAMGDPLDMWFRQDLDNRLPRDCNAFEVEEPIVIGGNRYAPPAPLVAFLTAESHGGTLRQGQVGWEFEPNVLTTPLIGHLATDGVIHIL
jgi:hypothetical protein